MPDWFLLGKAAAWLLLPLSLGLFELWRHNRMMARDRAESEAANSAPNATDAEAGEAAPVGGSTRGAAAEGDAGASVMAARQAANRVRAQRDPAQRPVRRPVPRRPATAASLREHQPSADAPR